jgi:hypothetical protein
MSGVALEVACEYLDRSYASRPIERRTQKTQKDAEDAEELLVKYSSLWNEPDPLLQARDASSARLPNCQRKLAGVP